jgi:hypothetical protein
LNYPFLIAASYMPAMTLLAQKETVYNGAYSSKITSHPGACATLDDSSLELN